jgi:hypothetical protein
MLRFVIAVPSKLDGWQSVSLCDSKVHLAVDTSELELAGVAAVTRFVSPFDERRFETARVPGIFRPCSS